jgi:flagellar biosynthetic protein FlhB
MSGEKTEKPTEQKLKKSRKDGQIPRTPDLSAWGAMFVATMLIPMVVSKTIEASQKILLQSTAVIAEPDTERALKLTKSAILDGAVVVAPLVISMFVVAILASAVQGGVRVATKQVKPDFKRLNPFTGLKRVVGPQAMWEAVKVLLKTAAIGGAMYYSVHGLIPVLLSSGTMPVTAILGTVGSVTLGIIRVAAGAGLILAVLDYFVARRRVMKQLRMSKQDIKDEHKQSEGDPQLKGQIRQRQLAMGRQRMMADVSKADVVLVNPTHVAIALRYDPAKGAPRVVAKGAGVVASKIRDLAAEHRVPMVQDVSLARALYSGCQIGDEIPADFYAAVARVLAFVMMLKSKGSAAGVHRNLPAIAA